MNSTDLTIKYYNDNAESFCNTTKNVDFSEFQKKFLKYLPKSGLILDLGCGSGRDSKVFKDRGYNVVAIDGSVELCKEASDFIGQDVICSTFQNYTPEKKFDGIWACASLLHLNNQDLISVINKLSNYLNKNGCFYMSFKCESFQGMRKGRFFNSMTEADFRKFMDNNLKHLKIQEMYISEDVRSDRENEYWVNAFVVLK